MACSGIAYLLITQLYTREDSSGRMVSPHQWPLHTQDNTTYKHKKHTSMPSVGFEPAIPATKPQTYSLDRAATGIGLKCIHGTHLFKLKIFGYVFGYIPFFFFAEVLLLTFFSAVLV
jgi:hypothetical protein